MTRPLADAPRQGSWAKCLLCGHEWVFAYVPMDLDRYLRCMRRATCPMCGTGTKHLICYEPGCTPAEAVAAATARDAAGKTGDPGRLVSHGFRSRTTAKTRKKKEPAL